MQIEDVPQTPAVSLFAEGKLFSELRLPDVGAIIFRDGIPIGARSGGYAYFPDRVFSSAETRALNAAVAGGWTLVRVPSDQFWFIVGQVLAQAGLRLTALPKVNADA